MLHDTVDFIKRLYSGFNDRQMEEVLAALDENVVWANGMEGGHVNGRDGVRGYWTRQWALIDPHVEPFAFSEDTNRGIVVDVHQTVRDLAGAVLFDGTVRHIFRIENSLVKRFDIDQ
jgi:hypothetical protein